jgi:hypothetical protein
MSLTLDDKIMLLFSARILAASKRKNAAFRLGFYETPINILFTGNSALSTEQLSTVTVNA